MAHKRCKHYHLHSWTIIHLDEMNFFADYGVYKLEGLVVNQPGYVIINLAPILIG